METTPDETGYYIRGDDGEEYGPSDLAELRVWADENRIGATTPIRRDEAGAEWRPLRSYPDLAALLSQAQGQWPGIASFTIAPFWMRFIAYAVDQLIMSALLIVLMAACLLLLMESKRIDPEALAKLSMSDSSPLNMYVIVAFVFVYVAYFTYFHGSTGQTPGKGIFGMTVVDGTGRIIGYRRAFFRALAAVIFCFPLCAGYWLALFTPYTRTLHDIVIGTIVVRRRRENESGRAPGPPV